MLGGYCNAHVREELFQLVGNVHEKLAGFLLNFSKYAIGFLSAHRDYGKLRSFSQRDGLETGNKCDGVEYEISKITLHNIYVASSIGSVQICFLTLPVENDGNDGCVSINHKKGISFLQIPIKLGVSKHKIIPPKRCDEFVLMP